MTLQYVPKWPFLQIWLEWKLSVQVSGESYCLFCENYMIVKLKYCIIRFYIFFFFLNNQLTFQFRIFHFQVSCETAFSTIRKYGIGLQVFLVISKINMEFLNPLYRKTLEVLK